MGVVSYSYVEHAHFAKKLPVLPPFRQKHAHFTPFCQKVPISYLSSAQKCSGIYFDHFLKIYYSRQNGSRRNGRWEVDEVGITVLLYMYIQKWMYSTRF